MLGEYDEFYNVYILREKMKRKKENLSYKSGKNYRWDQLHRLIFCVSVGGLLSACGEIGGGRDIVGVFIFVIASCFVSGMISFVKAYISLLVGENRALREIRDWFGSDGGERQLRFSVIQDLITENVESSTFVSTLVGDRLLSIKKYYERAKLEEGRSVPPRLQDLHRMTEQSLMSRTSVSWLRFMTNVLLILGICGTLWCVHEVMGGTGDKIARMSEALLPSGTAVAATIVLLCLRSIFESRAERFLSKLDDMTMCYILPGMQSAGKFKESLQDFSSNVKRFAESIKSYTTISNRLRGLASTIMESDERMAFLGKRIETAFQELQKDQQRWTLEYTQARKQSEDLEQILNKTRNLADRMLEKQEKLTSSVMGVDAVATSIGKVGDEWTKLSQGVALLAGNLQQTSDQLGSLLAAKTSSDQLLSTLEQLHITVDQLSVEVKQGVEQWTVDSRDLSHMADSVRSSSESFQGELKKIRQSVSSFRETAKALEQDIRQASSVGADSSQGKSSREGSPSGYKS